MEPNKEEDQIQKIFNTTLKMIMNLPQGTPTIILLKESGFIPISHEINIKIIMQARRIEEKEGNSLIRDNTTENSTWVKNNGNYEKIPHSEMAPETEEIYT